ncbi:DoxX family protein [Qipengyuania sediminis]|uniref:DoxX family protein n=1 Tax=Qipengyuania sediminis TaxID=1532023 RepID=UPI00105A66A9|nr:DoxX family protein [Qipengyuania sediminis]
MAALAAIIGRLCIAALFVMSGIAKLADPAGTAQYITANSTLPATLATPVGIFEIVAGVLLGLGLMTRLVAIVLAGYIALATLLFHSQITDAAQGMLASRNLAILGGLLMVFAYGQVSWRVSTWKERARRHDAEVAAAKAEARADALGHDRTVVVNNQGGAAAPAYPPGRTVADRTDGDPRT